MKITKLSERDILALQYSLLEELKHSKSSNSMILQDDDITNSLSESLKSERKTEILSIRVKPTIKQIIDDSSYSYGDVVEYFANKLIGDGIEKTSIDSCEECSNSVEIKRNSNEYNQFRNFVLKRDKVCQSCGSSVDMEVHHLLPFKQYNHLGADTNNGIVLCKDCHAEYHHKYGYKTGCNPITLVNFMTGYG